MEADPRRGNNRTARSASRPRCMSSTLASACALGIRGMRCGGESGAARRLVRRFPPLGTRPASPRGKVARPHLGLRARAGSVCHTAAARAGLGLALRALRRGAAPARGPTAQCRAPAGDGIGGDVGLSRVGGLLRLAGAGSMTDGHASALVRRAASGASLARCDGRLALSRALWCRPRECGFLRSSARGRDAWGMHRNPPTILHFVAATAPGFAAAWRVDICGESANAELIASAMHTQRQTRCAPVPSTPTARVCRTLFDVL